MCCKHFLKKDTQGFSVGTSHSYPSGWAGLELRRVLQGPGIWCSVRCWWRDLLWETFVCLALTRRVCLRSHMNISLGEIVFCHLRAIVAKNADNTPVFSPGISDTCLLALNLGSPIPLFPYFSSIHWPFEANWIVPFLSHIMQLFSMLSFIP